MSRLSVFVKNIAVPDIKRSFFGVFMLFLICFSVVGRFDLKKIVKAQKTC